MIALYTMRCTLGYPKQIVWTHYILAHRNRSASQIYLTVTILLLVICTAICPKSYALDFRFYQTIVLRIYNKYQLIASTIPCRRRRFVSSLTVRRTGDKPCLNQWWLINNRIPTTRLQWKQWQNEPVFIDKTVLYLRPVILPLCSRWRVYRMPLMGRPVLQYFVINILHFVRKPSSLPITVLNETLHISSNACDSNVSVNEIKRQSISNPAIWVVLHCARRKVYD